MSLVTAASLAARLGVPVSDKVTGAVEAGEAAVLAWLGAETLAEMSRSERVRQTFDRTTLAFSLGPLTELTALTEDGTAIDLDEIIPQFWWLERDDLSTCFKGGKTYRITYTSGWESESALPAPLREAVLLAAAQTYTIDMSAGGLVKTSESLGDWSVGYAQVQTSSMTVSTSLPLSATSLIGRYRRPNV